MIVSGRGGSEAQSVQGSVSPSDFGPLVDDQRRIGLSVLREVQAEHRVRLAFYSGSLVAGLGHPTSDIDLHVVLGPDEFLEHNIFDREEFRVQVTVVRPETLDSVASRTQLFLATRTDRRQTSFEATELWHLIRTCVSELVEGDDELVATFQAIDRHVAAQILMVRFATEASIFADDVDGMVQLREHASAYYTAGLALRAAIEVSLASQGDLYALPKFLFTRVARCAALAPCMPDLWNMLQAGPEWDDRVAMEQAVPRMLRAAQQLIADALLRGWDGPIDRFRLPRPTAVGPTRDPFGGLIRFSDAWAMPARSGPLRASDQIVALWAACTGQSIDDVADELAWHAILLQPGELDGVLAKLADRGVVSFP